MSAAVSVQDTSVSNDPQTMPKGVSRAHSASWYRLRSIVRAAFYTLMSAGIMALVSCHPF